MNLDEALKYARDVGLSDRHIAAAVRLAADDARHAWDDGLVALTHPKTGGVIRVHPDTVAQHELAGWQPVEPVSEEPDPGDISQDAPKPEETK